jgi:uncharacterized protein (TIRG00374 family)
MPKTKSRKPWRLIQKIFYYTIPPVILVYIFMNIDINSFFTSLKNIELKYYLLGLALYPLIICVGAYRWYYLKRKMINPSIPLSFSMNNYWIGRTVGFLAPGSIGWDVYRIIAATRKYGNLIKNTFVAVTEKLLGLAVCSLIIIVSFPFLDISSNDVINRIMVFAYIIFFSLVVFVAIGGLFSKRFEFVAKIANRVQKSLLDKLKNTRYKFSQYLQQETGEDHEIKYNLKSIIPSIPVLLVLSIIIQLGTSFAIWLIIMSLNYDLPYYVPLFVAPVLLFIFLLPISFGSLGIREGAYIFFYGIFGMDQEAALLLSFLTLSGTLFTVLIGAIVMQISSVRKIILALPTEKIQKEF